MTLNPSSPDDIKVRCPVCKNRFSIEHHNECPYCEAKEQMQTNSCNICHYIYDKTVHTSCPECHSKPMQTSDLYSCLKCNVQYSKFLFSCPNCGHKQKEKQMPKINPQPHNDILSKIEQALTSDNKDQQDIAMVGLQLICKLLDKNADYGSSAFKSPCLTPGIPAGTAIEVRMSDKLERIFNLLKGNTPKVAESLEDTFDDLLGYLVLRKIAKQRATNE